MRRQAHMAARPQHMVAHRLGLNVYAMDDFQEFKQMLPKMGVEMTEAKALRFFRNCDIDGGGDIDFDEFKMALYSCDPINGNAIGFQPTSYLAPKDAFDLQECLAWGLPAPRGDEDAARQDFAEHFHTFRVWAQTLTGPQLRRSEVSAFE